MSGEVRVQAEGAFRWVQASGSGRVWATASAPQSGLVGFCTEFSFTSAQNIVTIKERGRPDHHKIVGQEPIEVSVTFLWTGTNPMPVSGSGASVPMEHLEFKALRPEYGNSGFYYQFYGAAVPSLEFSEAEEGDTITMTFNCLGMSGVNTTGYLG